LPAVTPVIANGADRIIPIAPTPVLITKLDGLAALFQI
jgi:hypothetical protein